MASFQQEITVKGLEDSVASALMAAEDWITADQYDAAILSIKVDGRNKDGSQDPAARYMPIAFMDNVCNQQKIEAMSEKTELSDEEKVQAFNTIKLHRLMKSVKNEMIVPDNNPLEQSQPFRLPPSFFNLRKYLTYLKWPPAKYASFEIRIQLFDKPTCQWLSSYRSNDYPAGTELNWTPSDPSAAKKKTLFLRSEAKAKEIRALYEQLQFSIGDDSIRPFLGLKLRLMDKTPAAIAERFNKNDLFTSLQTERAFMGQIYNQAESIHTPEAYKAVIKLIDFEGLTKRMMIKAFLILLAMLEDPESETVDPDMLVTDWKRTFKEKIVMLLVNSFVLSAHKEFLNGEIFAR